MRYRMASAQVSEQYCIYWNPKDFHGKFVTRRYSLDENSNPYKDDSYCWKQKDVDEFGGWGFATIEDAEVDIRETIDPIDGSGSCICEIYEAKAINPLGMCSAAQMIDCIAGFNEEVSPLEESWSSFLGLEDNSYKDTPIGEKLSAMLMQAYESFAIENNLPIWYTCDMKECVAKVIVT